MEQFNYQYNAETKPHTFGNAANEIRNARNKVKLAVAAFRESLKKYDLHLCEELTEA